MDESLIAPAISLVAVAIPLAASYFSGDKHLREMREQARTHDALPDGHHARDVISREMVVSAALYKHGRRTRWRLQALRAGIVTSVASLAILFATAGARGEAVDRMGKDLLWIGDAVAVALGATSVYVLVLLIRGPGPRRRKAEPDPG